MQLGSHSLNVLTLSFPCLQGSKRNIRIPLFGLKQHFVVKHSTMDAMLKVVCWSLECLFLGIMPSQRHDGLPWGKDDTQRKKWSGKPLQLQAMLTQFRGACFVLKILLFFFEIFRSMSPGVQALVQEIGRCSRTFFACLSTMNWLVAVGFAQQLPSP